MIARIADNATPPIQIDELLTQFDRICNLIRDGVHQVIGDRARAGTRALLKQQYVDAVRVNLDIEYNRLRADEMDKALKAIILELRAPANGTQEDATIITKKKDAILCLCSAARACSGRRYEETFKVYRVLSTQVESVEEVVKRFVQEMKEDLFLNYYSLSTESVHMLNYIRASVGAQLGLNISPVNLGDPNIYIGRFVAVSPDNPRVSHSQPAQFLEVFSRMYTPSNILSIMKNFLNRRIESDPAFMRLLSKFIDDEIRAYAKDGQLDSDDLQALPMPYQTHQSHLTDAGIKFIMVHFGYLNSDTLNGHLVRGFKEHSTIEA